MKESSASWKRWVSRLVERLKKWHASPVAYSLLQSIRLLHTSQPIKPTETPATDPARPVGPFVLDKPHAAGDLLVYVPRSLESHLVDAATGQYGYSHVAVDTGETDLLTGKRVMVESTLYTVVHRSYQDKYGQRPYVRIPSSRMGIDGLAFAECTKSKLGEAYDYPEALTWGQVDNPSKQICSDLAADCLPVQVKEAFANARGDGVLGRGMVSVFRRKGQPLRVFISPNGFARFFGAPHGKEIDRPDTLLPSRPAVWPRVTRPARLGGVAALAGLTLTGWILLSRPRHRHKRLLR